MSKTKVAREFARRAKEFHRGENPMNIELWGLFGWGDISPYVKTKEIILNPGYGKSNKTVWCKPSQAFFDKWIKPLLDKNP